MEAGIWISAGAAAISLIGLALATRRTTREDAAASARLEAKLNGIASGVEDIRVESRTARARIDALTERVSRAEESCKSAHRRIDRMEVKG